MAFCKDFNAKTADLKDDVPVPVKITAYTDKSFIYTTKTPPISYFLKKAAGLEGGAKRPGHESAGTVVWQRLTLGASRKFNFNLHFQEDFHSDDKEQKQQQ
ncbi:hypothetical protein WJX84_008885, partial [Apatococcus fuscideae]